MSKHGVRHLPLELTTVKKWLKLNQIITVAYNSAKDNYQSPFKFRITAKSVPVLHLQIAFFL